MYAVACKDKLKIIGNEKLRNHLGIDIKEKRKCKAMPKDDNGRILDELFFGELRIDLIYELYITKSKDGDRRSFVRHTE